MKDLSVFPDNSFDLIFNPCSILFVDNVLPVWQECFRVFYGKGKYCESCKNEISKSAYMYILLPEFIWSKCLQGNLW